MRPGCLRWVLVACMGPAWLHAPVAAQQMVGELVGGATGQPIQGALVYLITEDGRPVARGMSDPAGQFTLVAPSPGRYRVRADRIGFASTVSSPVDIGDGETTHLRMRATVEAVALDGIDVAAHRRCVIRPEDGDVHTVWQEAQKALANAAWTDQQSPFRYRIRTWTRNLEARSLKVGAELSNVTTSDRRRTFESLTAADLATGGYARADGDAYRYFAPDAEVLLSDEFLDSHCMGLTEGHGDRAGLIGLAFEPAPDVRVPDISGVLWLDPASTRLQQLDYEYVNLDRLFPELDEIPADDRIGGRVEFSMLPTGPWIVDKWHIRMPVYRAVRRAGRSVAQLSEVIERGAQVLDIRDLGGASVQVAGTASLRGAVVGVDGAPLSGTTVSLVGTDYTTRTDADGTFAFADLVAGIYDLQATHPTFDSIGYVHPAIPAEATEANAAYTEVRMPDRWAIVAQRCEAAGPDAPPRAGDTGAVVGWVREAESGLTLGGAGVTASWIDVEVDAGRQQARQRPFELHTRADDSGFFMLCGVPRDQDVRIEAEFGVGSARRTAVRIPFSKTAVHQDVSVSFGDHETRHTVIVGGSAIRGWILSVEGDRLAAATVALDGERSTSTDEAGYFEFPDVIPGERTLAVHAFGGAPLERRVEVAAREAVEIEVRVAPEAIELEGIEVRVLSQREIEYRSLGTVDASISAERMDELRPLIVDLATVLRKELGPSVRIGQTSSNGLCIEPTRRRPSLYKEVSGCRQALIVIDGMPFQGGTGFGQRALEILRTINLEEVEDVRWIPALDAMLLYGRDGRYGVLIVRTRRGGDQHG